MKTTVYAVRDIATKNRMSYRWRSRADAEERKTALEAIGFNNIEIYKTTQDLPLLRKSR